MKFLKMIFSVLMALAVGVSAQEDMLGLDPMMKGMITKNDVWNMTFNFMGRDVSLSDPSSIGYIFSEMETMMDSMPESEGESRAVAMLEKEQKSIEGVEESRFHDSIDFGSAIPKCSPFSVQRYYDGTCDVPKKPKGSASFSASDLLSGLSGASGSGFLCAKGSKSGFSGFGRRRLGASAKSRRTGPLRPRMSGGSERRRLSHSGGDDINRYAWGADCYNDSVGTVCVMAHSGGTPAALSQTSTKPVLTLRSGEGNPGYADQDIIAKVELDDENFGLRSASVWKINRDEDDNIQSVVLLFGDITRGGEASLIQYTVYIDHKSMSSSGSGSGAGSGEKCDDFDVDKETLLGPGSSFLPNYDVPGTSIRSLRRLPAGSYGSCTLANDVVVFATLSELASGFGGGARVFVYDPETPSDEPIEVTLDLPTHTEGYDMFPAGIWDFKLDLDGGIAYYNTVRVLAEPYPIPDRLGGFDFNPELYHGEVEDICTVYNSGTNGTASLLSEFDDIRTNNINASVTSLEPLPDGKILACTMSGFVYQFLAAFGGVGDSRRELQLIDQSDLSLVELGMEQICYACDTSDDSCVSRTPPSQNILSAYIWDLETCGGYIFAGTLDLTGLFASLIKGLLVGFLSEFSLTECLDFENPILNLILEIVTYIILSFVLGMPIYKANGGFNLMYAPVNDLNNWSVVTADGFNRVTDMYDDPAAIFDEEGFLGYLRNRSVEDGVRNMVCSDDRWLHVGTAVYGDKPSNTYVIDTDPSTMSSFGPLCPPFTFAPSAAPSSLPSAAPSSW